MIVDATNRIVVYSKTNCPQCVVVKNQLTKKGVDFEEVNIEKDATMRAWLIAAGHRQVPVVYVDDVFVPNAGIVLTTVE